MAPELTTTNYISYLDCSFTCFSTGGGNVESDNLIKELAYNISTTALPKLTEMATTLKYQFNVNSSNEIYSSEHQELDNITGYFNRTYGIDDFLNISESEPKLNFTDLTYSFIDYLTLVLHDFVGDNETKHAIDFDITTFSPRTDISTDVATTDFPSTYFSSAEHFNVFKSTVVPIIVKTVETTEFVDTDRFDYDLNSLYGEISSTVSSLKENCTKVCENIKIPVRRNVTSVVLLDSEPSLNYTMKSRLRSLCWETMFGQELIRLTVMDLVMTIASTLAMDFFRGLFVRVMNR